MEGVEEGGDLASGGKGREGIAERVKAFLELRAVLQIPGIEPATAGEEPVARVADWREKAVCQVNLRDPYHFANKSGFKQSVKGKRSLHELTYIETDFFLDREHLNPHLDCRSLLNSRRAIFPLMGHFRDP